MRIDTCPVFAAVLLWSCQAGVVETPVETDLLPPTIISTTPAQGAADVALEVVLLVVFNEAIDPATVNSVSLSLRDNSGTGLAASVFYEEAALTASLEPLADLAPASQYTATVSANVADLAGNSMAVAHIWSFSTAGAADITPPTVVSTAPATDATNVAYDANIVVTFSEPIATASVTTVTFTLTPGGGTVSASGNTATLNPNGDMLPNTTYTALLTTGLTDLAGNPMAGNYSWSFTTTSEPKAVLTWTAPTLNEDGSELTDLEGYIVCYGTTPRSGPTFVYDVTIDIGMPSCAAAGDETECTYTVVDVDFDPGDTFYFAVKAYDGDANESVYSNEASKDF